MTNFNHDQFIRDAIGGTIPEQYQAYVGRLVRAYDERDDGIRRTIRDEARRRGLGGDQVDRLFVQAGLLVREPVNAVRTAGQADVPGDDRLGRIEATVNALVEAAERQGIHVQR